MRHFNTSYPYSGFFIAEDGNPNVYNFIVPHNLRSGLVCIKGEKVEFRILNRENIKTLVNWRNDPEVAYWATGGDPKYEFRSEEEANRDLSWHMENSSMLDGYQFAIFTHDGKFIGTADYREVDHVKRSCTVGITIGDQNYWGKGYGTDALSVLAEYLFNRLNLRRIQLDTWSGNDRAIKSYKKCGFQVEGILKENEFVNGKYYDTVIMGLLKSHWKGSSAETPL